MYGANNYHKKSQSPQKSVATNLSCTLRLWGLSTSGQAIDVLYALQVARAMGLTTIGLTGEGGGRMAPWCDVLIRVPFTLTHEVQERHLPIYHTLC